MYPAKHILQHTISLLLTVGITFIWLHVQALTQYSLQAFAFSVAVFFIVKRSKKAKFWHILPSPLSIEMIVVTFAFLLLIGATGNLSSQFFPLGYLHLFFLTLASHYSTTIVVTATIMVFHLALTPDVGSREISTLLSLPMLTIFFLFAKKQYDEVILDRAIILKEEQQLKGIAKTKHATESFLKNNVKPQLYSIWQKSLAESNQEIQSRLEALIQRVDEHIRQ